MTGIPLLLALLIVSKSIPQAMAEGTIIGASANSITIEITTNGKRVREKLRPDPLEVNKVDVFNLDPQGNPINPAREKRVLAEYLKTNAIRLPNGINEEVLKNATQARTAIQANTQILKPTAEIRKDEGSIENSLRRVDNTFLNKLNNSLKPPVGGNPALSGRPNVNRGEQSVRQIGPQLPAKPGSAIEAR